MPKRQRTRKITRSKRRKVARRSRRGTYIPRGIMPSNKKILKLKYSDDWVLNPTIADIPYQAYFSACSLYDPDRSGSGHSAKLLDQMAGYYQHYTVLGAKISVRAINPGGSAVPMMVFVIKTDQVTPTNLGSKNQLLEATGSRYAYVSKDGDDRTVRSTYSKKKTWGKSATDKLTALTNANPTDEIFWQVSAINTQASVTPTPIPIIVTIDYIALFTERIQQDIS